ncbi:MAG: ethylbenzene dehydrogenase-related protein [Candidatus Omnitrophota bacterium]
MKKFTIILICIVSIIGFAALAYYGLRYSRGVPVAIEEEPEKVNLKVPFVDSEIDLSKGVDLGGWDAIPSQEIELVYQVMVLPWGKSLVSPVSVKAFHNRKDIFFYITWSDSTENRMIGTSTFSDACAVMFPIDDDAQPSSLMMGFLDGANIWHWKAVRDSKFWLKEEPKTTPYVDFHYPFEKEELFPVQDEALKSAVNDLMAIRVGTITMKSRQDVEGRGLWDNGTWHIVIKRSLKHIDDKEDAVFKLGEKRLCAFAVWEGESGDRGGRKSISNWAELQIE